MIATLELVELRRGGGVLTAAVTAGATVLPLDLTLDYDEAGGLLELGGEVYTYTAVGDDFVTLASGVLADAEVDTPAWTVDAEGNREETWIAWVDLDDNGDTVPASIPTSLIGYFPEGDVAAGQDVEVEASADGYRVVSRPDQAAVLDGSVIDPTSTIPGGQAFSLDAPTATDGYPEDYGWWQVDATGKVLGFWRLVGGVWTAQAIVTAEALKANNALITALTGTTITGATVQTRADPDRGVKLGQVQGSTNYDEAFIVFNESGVPFIKAVPAEELAVIAGEVKAISTTVTDGASLGGITEVTRATDGTAGAVRLTGYTTAPKSAPTVTSGYDSVQFADDGNWDNRRGWATDGTYWYTSMISGDVEKWSATGAWVTSGAAQGECAGVVHHAGGLYVLVDYLGDWSVWKFNASDLSYVSKGAWTQEDGTLTPTIGVDSATGDLLIAQSRPSDVTVPNRVRIRRYTMPATSGDPLVAGSSVDTGFAYSENLAGVTYGTHDLGANRYVFTNDTGLQFRVVDTTGAAVSAEDFESSMGVGKVGFTYTGGAFVSMAKSGLMRTYTGQDKAVAIGNAALTKWVSNDLSTATLHTDQSPRAKVTIKKRTKLNVTTSVINTGGANSPDRVRIFVGQGAADPGRTAMWKQTDPSVGVISASYSSLATSGTNPVTPNGFIGAGGTVQRLELADGTSFIDGIGGGSAWTTYTPTFTAATTNPTLASFTIAGRYARLPRNAITFSIVITATAASGYGSGTYSFGLPVAARNADEIVVTGAQTGPNHGYIGRSNAGSTSAITLLLTSTDAAINVTNSGMATGTVLRITGTYEAA